MNHFLILCFAVLTSSQVTAQSLNLPRIHDQFIKACTPADSNGNRSFAPDSNSTLYGFAQANQRMIEYLFINYRALETQYLWAHESDSARFAGNVSDSTLNNLFFEELAPLIDNYFFVTKAKHLEGIPAHGIETISTKKLKHFSIRFFYPFLMEGGRVAMHICVGANGFQGMEPPRNFMIEAFCYSAIMPHTLIQNDPLIDDVSKALNALNGLSLDGTATEIQAQIKDHVWKVMLKSDALSAVLQTQYDAMNGWLTFRVE
jgi:hypothetical protein